MLKLDYIREFRERIQIHKYQLSTIRFSRSRSLFAVARQAVCRLSSVCLSVTFVRPTQAVVNFGNFSFGPFGTLAIH